jgi:disulfide oxidoreductase YuzD
MSKQTPLLSFCLEDNSLKCTLRRKFPNVIFNDVYYIDSVQVNKMKKKEEYYENQIKN